MHKKGGAGCHVYCLFVNVAYGRKFLNTLSPGFVAPWLKLCLHQKLNVILIKAKQLLDGVKRDLIRQSHFDYFVFVFQFKVPLFRRHSRWFQSGYTYPSETVVERHVMSAASKVSTTAISTVCSRNTHRNSATSSSLA